MRRLPELLLVLLWLLVFACVYLLVLRLVPAQYIW